MPQFTRRRLLKTAGGLALVSGISAPAILRAQTADVTSFAVHQRVARGLAYVPQGRQIFGTMTVSTPLR